MPTAPFHHHHLYWHVYLLLLAKILLLLLLAAVVVAIQSNAELQAKKFLDHMDRPSSTLSKLLRKMCQPFRG